MMYRASQPLRNAYEGSKTPLARAIAATCGCLLSTSVMAQTATEEPQRVSEVQMDTMRVEANYQGDPARSYTVPETTSSTGLDLSPRETPQSVTSITRQQLDDQQIVNIEQALALTPGISSSKSEVGGRTAFRARGYSVSNWKVNGLAFPGGSDFSNGGNALNMDLYEHIDIVRGANGLLGGTGDPSATVDLIRKRPEKTFGGSAYATYGSWDTGRAGVDVNVPLTEDGRIRSRFVVTQQEGDGFRDHESSRDRAALATFEFDVSDATTLGVGYQYEYNKTYGAGWGANIPIWYASGQLTDLPRSNNLAPSWSYGEYQTDTLFASLEHAFNDDWSLDINIAQSDIDAVGHRGLAKVNRGSGGTYIGYWDEEDGSGAILNGLHNSTETRQRSAQFDLSGAFDAIGRRHDVMFGYNESRTRARSPDYTCTMSSNTTTIHSSNCLFRANNGLPVTDWRHGVDADFTMEASKTGRSSLTETRLRGLYAATRLSITEPLSVILGARTSYYKTESETSSGEHSSQHDNGVVTPYAGVVYDLTDNHSLYASYTSTFTPQTRETSSGATVKPIVGDSYETGVKGEWFDGRLNASAAYFRTRQDNKAVRDGGNVTPTGGQAYKAGTGNETDGIDLEIAGALTPNWNIYGGYTYLHFRRVDSDGRSDPSHLLKLSTTYEPSGFLNRMTFGGGVYAQSNIHAISGPAGQPTNGVSTGSTAVSWPGYATVNAMAKYDISDETSVTLNVDNLFDQRYYNRYGFYAGAIYGAPRSASLTLRTEL